MAYTKAEAESIKANLAKIQEYVTENYIPRLRQYDRIKVDFGDMKRSRSHWDMEHEHSFGFDWDGSIWYRCGGLCLFFTPGNQYPSNSIFDCWTYAPDLLLNWQKVKRLVENEIDEQERKRAALASFEV